LSKPAKKPLEAGDQTVNNSRPGSIQIQTSRKVLWLTSSAVLLLGLLVAVAGFLLGRQRPMRSGIPAAGAISPATRIRTYLERVPKGRFSAAT
jgi:hypothetical protein